MEPQYCRSNTKREYLECNLYELSKEGVSNRDKENIYWKVFSNELNLSFHKPKKDRCDICDTFRNVSNPTENDKDKFAAHERNKIQNRQEKERMTEE